MSLQRPLLNGGRRGNPIPVPPIVEYDIAPPWRKRLSLMILRMQIPLDECLRGSSNSAHASHFDQESCMPGILWFVHAIASVDSFKQWQTNPMSRWVWFNRQRCRRLRRESAPSFVPRLSKVIDCPIKIRARRLLNRQLPGRGSATCYYTMDSSFPAPL